MAVTIEEVQIAAASAVGLTRWDLLDRGRNARTAKARTAAMVVARRLPGGPSYPELGRAFGRDHTTVLVQVRRGVELERRDPWFADLVRQVERAAGIDPVNGACDPRSACGASCGGDR